MSKKYSASLKGFFDTDIHEIIPNDAVTVTDEDYRALFEAQSARGMVIVPNDNGYPVAVPPTMTGEQKLIMLKSRAVMELRKTDVTILRCTEHNVAVPEPWVNYRSLLRDIVSGRVIADALPDRPEYPAGT
jgi:hypothetical protein